MDQIQIQIQIDRMIKVRANVIVYLPQPMLIIQTYVIIIQTG